MSRQFWNAFLNVYMSMPCLWQIKSPEYTNREKKGACLDKLAEMCREIEPAANRDYVLRKINSFRTTFRKEHKKIYNPKWGPDYVPGLWYYHILLPTAEQQPTRMKVEAKADTELELHEEFYQDPEHAEAEQVGEEGESMLSEQYTESPGTSERIVSPSADAVGLSGSRKRTREVNDDTDLLHSQQVGSNLKGVDEYDCIGINVAAKLRAMSKINPVQSIIAEKLISDVLYYGQLEALTRNSFVMIPEATEEEQVDQTVGTEEFVDTSTGQAE